MDHHNFESRSISELVSFLRTAFRDKDFDKVEEVLVAKEVKMRKEIEIKNKEYELLQSKYEFLRLDNLTHESMVEQDKVEADPKGFGKLKEMESEIQQLKELIIKVNEDREKKKSALDGFAKTLEVVKEAQEDDKLTVQKLNYKNSQLQSAIEAAKKENKEYKKTTKVLRRKNLRMRRRKYEELEHRVSQLENVSAIVENGEPIASNRNDNLNGKRVDKIDNEQVNYR